LGTPRGTYKISPRACLVQSNGVHFVGALVASIGHIRRPPLSWKKSVKQIEELRLAVMGPPAFAIDVVFMGYRMGRLSHVTKRLLFSLVLMQGEAAEILGVSVRTVQRRLNRSLLLAKEPDDLRVN
jgi:hypothetical protein